MKKKFIQFIARILSITVIATILLATVEITDYENEIMLYNDICIIGSREN